MPSAIILLQPERTVNLTASGGATPSITQESLLAADVAKYQFVVPMIRVVRSSDNALASGTGLQFNFLTAALLASPDDENAKGTRFFDTGYIVDVAKSGGIIGASTNGLTFVGGISNGVISAIQNPGGLLLWKVTNMDTLNAQTFRFEIHLICRGP